MQGALDLEDDACTYLPEPGHELVLTADALVSGVHFLPDDPAGLVARKMLRVNLSDLAAKGAAPIGYLMTTAFPKETDESWVAAFAAGLALDQAEFGLSLMGGDTVATPGPLSLSLTAIGSVPAGKAIRRKGALPGDIVLVSGTIGDGALGLRVLRGEFIGLPEDVRACLVGRYRLPQPRLGLGRAMLASGLVHAMMDVSDGLVADLRHIAEASRVGALLDAAAVPLSEAAAAILADATDLLPFLLTGGDDYELLLTTAPGSVPALRDIARQAGTPVTPIGRIVAGSGLSVVDRDQQSLALGGEGFRHF